MSPVLGKNPSEMADIPLEKLSTLVSDIKDSIVKLEMENYIFETYLQKMDPTALVNWQASADAINFQAKLAASRKSLASTASSIKSSQSKFSLKITTQYKFEMAEKELFTIEQDRKLFTIDYSNKKILFKTKLEELQQRIAEFVIYKEDFENFLIKNKPKRGRIPGEKVIAYISKHLKGVDALILKLRLQRGYLLQKLRTISTLLISKYDKAQLVSPIDFEYLSLINVNLRKKLLRKDLSLYSTRLLTAQAKLDLSIRKQFLDFQCKQFHRVKHEVNRRAIKTEALQNTSKNIEKELMLMRDKMDQTLYLRHTFNVPKVESYMDARLQLNALKSQIKAWTRKQYFQHVKIEKLKNKVKKHNFILKKLGIRQSIGSMDSKTNLLFLVTETEHNLNKIQMQYFDSYQN